MKSNKLTIKINKPNSEIFAFYINPKNTPLWIDSIKAEVTNEWPVKLGTIYKSQNEAGEWSEYIVTAFEVNKLFELTSKDGNYHVKYTHRVVDENTSEIEYLEWVDKGELKIPFTLKDLEKMKSLISA